MREDEILQVWLSMTSARLGKSGTGLVMANALGSGNAIVRVSLRHSFERIVAISDK